MKTKIITLSVIFTLFFYVSSLASHIVGGEIQFYPKDVTQGKYYIGLNLYFDVANGRTQAEDQNITLYIFRKSDNAVMTNITLPQTTRKLISYTNQACSTTDENLQTRLIIYSGEIAMSAANYNSPEGYYIVWERCCRNQIIVNIVNPSRIGETFYLAIPPLTTVNSSPVFAELKGDYICYNRPFSFDFSGKDPDGDSLAYSLVNPYAGNSNAGGGAAPIPRGSSTYPEVIWASGYGLDNIIPGTPPLSINRLTGRLNLRANQRGVFVFCVLVEEFRDNKRIGYARREFQLKVVDCQPNEKPSALFREVGKQQFYKEGTTINIKKDQTKCFDFLITDPDAGQRLIITSKALNFDDKAITVSPAIFTTRNATDTLKAQICFDKCVESRNGQPMVFEVIATDDGCPQGYGDTLRVRMLIEPAFNNRPDVTTDATTTNVNQQTQLRFNVKGVDLDNDDLILEAKPRGFAMSQVGMSFVNGTGKGTVNQPFVWNTTCTTLTDRDYVIDFIVTDISCNRQTKDTVTVRLRALPRPNKVPDISTSLTGNTVVISQPTEKKNGISFDVFANDADKDNITLTAVGQGFTLSNYKMKFADKNGSPTLTSKFEWTPDCKTIADLVGKTLTVDFVSEDNSCGTSKKNTLSVVFKIQDLPGSGALPDQIPNVITPNGDGKNDCFVVENLTTSLCGPLFQNVVIVNRWGKRVFESSDKNFAWCADGYNSGQFFYNMVFSDRIFKGTVTVMK